jgi:hypothetical protein
MHQSIKPANTSSLDDSPAQYQQHYAVVHATDRSMHTVSGTGIFAALASGRDGRATGILLLPTCDAIRSECERRQIMVVAAACRSAARTIDPLSALAANTARRYDSDLCV